MASPHLLEVRHLRTHFFTDAGVIRAVDDVDLALGEGEVLGLVGETGSGKSMTAASILGLVPEPGRIVGGEILFEGRDLVDADDKTWREVRGGRIGLVVQNVRSAFNPLITVGRQIRNVWERHLELSPAELDEYGADLLRSVGFADPRRVLNSYPHQLSGGMAQRVMIAIAIGARPRLVIADEPTTGLDATVQVEVLDLLMSKLEEVRAAALIITHDLAVVAQYTHRIAVMHAGQIVEQSSTGRFFDGPFHPYGISLTASLHPQVPESLERFTMASDPVDPANPPTGCKYRTRCHLATEQCVMVEPALAAVESGHLARCHHALQARAEAQDVAGHGSPS